MNYKILVIDDRKEDRDILKRCLNEAGYNNIIEAESGESGIEKAQLEKPSLIILDTVMPGIDGFETCKQIKAIEGLKTKIIICTSSIDAVDAHRARAMGCDDYCVKANDNESLIEAVKKFI